MDTDSKKVLSEYADWAESLWLSGPKEGWGLKDQAIMSLGLVGEAIEALEVAVDHELRSESDAIKEMGDSLYYWSLMARDVGLEPASLFPQNIAGPRERLDWELFRSKAERMVIAAGQVSEAQKKRWRDETSPEKLIEKMERFAESWVECCEALGISWQGALRVNQSKVNDRKARGALKGSGNHR